MDITNVLPPFWKDEIKAYLKADAPTFDIGGFVVGSEPLEAILLAKSKAVLAGKPFFEAVFEELGCTIEWLAKEGELLEPPRKVAVVKGPARCLLLGERTALNIISRASGIATMSRELSDIAKAHKWHGEVAGTRKVTPGFRLVEKYALLVGGVSTHRMDLSQMVMLKDNHIWAAGSITAAVKAAKSVGGFSTKIEVEARNLGEALEAAGAGADIVMLDNYTPEGLAEDAKALKAKHPHVIVEASGGITRETLSRFFSPHIDVVSMGALTHGYSVCDFSLKINKGAGADSIAKLVGGSTASGSAAASGGGGAAARSEAPATGADAGSGSVAKTS